MEKWSNVYGLDYRIAMRKFSKKRAALERIYIKKAKHYLREHDVCEVVGCSAPSTQIHHKRGRLGTLLIDTDNFLSVCYPHHRMIEENPNWAKENGYSKNRIE